MPSSSSPPPSPSSSLQALASAQAAFTALTNSLIKPPTAFEQTLRRHRQGPLSMPVAEQAASPALEQTIDRLAATMVAQFKAHQTAMSQTHTVFEQLLDLLAPTTEAFAQALQNRALHFPVAQPVSIRIEPDRSVGVVRLLWHTLSFTTRGNSHPLALERPGREPLFSGRIVVLQGDLTQLAPDWEDTPVALETLLEYELASLFVPADALQPAILRMPHKPGDEVFYHQASAAQQFLLKTLEVVCHGGFLHEG